MVWKFIEFNKNVSQKELQEELDNFDFENVYVLKTLVNGRITLKFCLKTNCCIQNAKKELEEFRITLFVHSVGVSSTNI